MRDSDVRSVLARKSRFLSWNALSCNHALTCFVTAPDAEKAIWRECRRIWTRFGLPRQTRLLRVPHFLLVSYASLPNVIYGPFIACLTAIG